MQKKCLSCGSENMSSGDLRLAGEAGSVYYQPSESKSWFSNGESIVSLACVDCGYIQSFVNKEKLAKNIKQ